MGRGRARRSVAVVAVVLAVGVASSLPVYLATFGTRPPSRVNLLFWIDGYGPDCNTGDTIAAERDPILGQGVAMADICPEAGYGPPSDDLLARAEPLVAVVVLALIGLALLVWPRRR